MNVLLRFPWGPRRRPENAENRSTGIALGTVNAASSVMQDRSYQRLETNLFWTCGVLLPYMNYILLRVLLFQLREFPIEPMKEKNLVYLFTQEKESVVTQGVNNRLVEGTSLYGKEMEWGFLVETKRVKPLGP